MISKINFDMSLETNNVSQIQQQNGNCNMENISNKNNKKQLCGGDKQAIEKMLEFGRQLYSQSIHLRQQHGKNESNKKMLQDAFSLLAYANPWNSPVGWQLDPQQRETVCARLNSAILGKRITVILICILYLLYKKNRKKRGIILIK